MKFRLFLILWILFICGSVAAQPAETNYLGNVVVAGYDDDSSYGPLNIGFTFNFYGNNYSQFYINSNGMILFGAGSSESIVATIPTVTEPNNYIAPFWDDLVVDPAGKILYTTIGASPNRKLIVQFTNMGFYTSPVILGTFQVILYETSNKIQIQYRLLADDTSTRTHGGTATIGLENLTGTDGTLYAFQDPIAVSTEQAISFTPPGPLYTTNNNAVYEGVYLTTNLSLPEPGITNLINPPDDAVIGADYLFEWSGVPNAASYSLHISPNSDLSGSTGYDAGTNLNYSVTGLTLDATYFWGVFATNATGTTWCEIKRFTTSSAPPLAPVPQTIWTEQFQDKTIRLQSTGGDTSPKTALITSLPLQGQLYQYNAGARGSQITSASLLVPATITDAGMNVIYAASGGSGNGVGNFNFKIYDSPVESPVGLITVNVSPPGVPNVLYAAKLTDVEIQFDIPMADPAGKQNQFTVKVGGTPVIINSASLKTGDPYTIILSLATPLIATDSVLISYTPGNIIASSGGFLLPFTDEPVTLTSQTINFSQSLSKKYSDSPFILSANATSGLGITWSSSNLTVSTIISNVATFRAIGSSDITARQLGNSTYAPAKYIKTLTVAKGDQTITFIALPSKTVGDADFTPSASASSGLSISFSSNNTAVATIVAGKIHIVSGGSAVITASQTGNTNYNAATSVQQTLTVADAVNKTLNLTSVLLQGLYDVSGTMRRTNNDLGPVFANPLISDQIIVELHNSTYSSIAYTAINVNLSTTGTATVSIPAIFNGSYYITIRHRNHIETTTSSLVSFNGSTISYAFDQPSKVYGGNLILMAGPGSYYAIYGGDVNQNGLVESFDMTPIDNLSSNFGYGYIEDVNSDGLIDSRDMTIVDNNNSGFVSSILP